MNGRLYLLVTLVFGLSSCSILSNTEENNANTEEISNQIVNNLENSSVTMPLTLDEAAEKFGTPTFDELNDGIEKEIKKTENKRFWYDMFVWMPNFILSIFRKQK